MVERLGVRPCHQQDITGYLRTQSFLARKAPKSPLEVEIIALETTRFSSKYWTTSDAYAAVETILESADGNWREIFRSSLTKL
jgi:hypothetical protein